MAAPKPVPTALKLVMGNPGKRAINKAEPQPKKGIPKMPSHLDAKAKTAWSKLCKELDSMGVLTLADAYALEVLVGVYAQIRDLQKALKTHGSTTYKTIATSGEEVYKAYPEYGQLIQAQNMFRSYITEFGLTPSSRSKVSTTDKVENDPLDKYGV